MIRSDSDQLFEFTVNRRALVSAYFTFLVKIYTDFNSHEMTTAATEAMNQLVKHFKNAMEQSDNFGVFIRIIGSIASQEEKKINSNSQNSNKSSPNKWFMLLTRLKEESDL